MFDDLGQVVLRDGEIAGLGVVRAPDEEWRGRVEHLLGHKGEVWRWQVRQMLAGQPQVLAQAEPFFYVLHRDHAPLANIMTIEARGVGVLGHVFTLHRERGRGAASLLMEALLRHFRERGGQALYLSTGFNSNAFRIYARRGFEPVEPNSGVMSFFSASRSQFESAYFAPGAASVAPLDWAAWASGSALFAGGFAGVVRNVAHRLLGRDLTEQALLYALRDEQQRHERGEQGEEPRVLVLRKPNAAVVGLASWGPHPMWPGAALLDVYCHPNFWNRAGDLLSALAIPRTQRLIAYADTEDESKARALEAAGFRRVATLPQWVDADSLQTRRHDVAVWSRA